MLKRLQRILILTVIAVIACGNGLSFAATDTLANHHVAAVSDATPSHDHHLHVHNVQEHGQTDPSAIADQCGDIGCNSADHEKYPCCHTHGHCCTSVLSIVADHSTVPVLGDGALLIAAAAPLPLGTISYPLLRPPRIRV